MHVEHDTRDFGMQERTLAGDGVVTGIGYVDGRPVASFSQDFTVAGGSLGKVHAEKICNVMDYAGRAGLPIVGFNDSGGARIQEGVESLSGYGKVFQRNIMMSGVVPQIAVIAGPCAGGAAYSPALMDFIIMTRHNAHMFICGPDVIRAVTGEVTTMDEIGSASAHASISGNIHFIAEDDRHAIQIVKRLLSFLPSNNVVDPPHTSLDELSLENDDAMNGLVPESPKDPIDTLQVINRLVDGDDFMEIQPEFAKNIVIVSRALVALSSVSSAISRALKRHARYRRLGQGRALHPLLQLLQHSNRYFGRCTWFSARRETRARWDHSPWREMLFAYGGTTVPKITVFMRKAYGGAYLAMCSRDLGADLAFAWPTAEIAVMGADGAVNILYRRELAAAEDPAALRAKLPAEYREKVLIALPSASKGLITDIIEPARTRAAVALDCVAFFQNVKAGHRRNTGTSLSRGWREQWVKVPS